jgi:uncharacterized membrane protein (DUF2068 family)
VSTKSREDPNAEVHRPPAGLIALSGFFALGAVIAGVAAVALLFPAARLEPLWHLNPEAHAALVRIGPWAVALMLVVASACALSAVGLWIRARWGHRLALVLLAVNLVGDTTAALSRGDFRTLIGLPIAGALIAYLLSARVRGRFLNTKAAA